MTGMERLSALEGDARDLAKAVLADWIREIDALQGDDPETDAVIAALLDGVIEMDCALRGD